MEQKYLFILILGCGISLKRFFLTQHKVFISIGGDSKVAVLFWVGFENLIRGELLVLLIKIRILTKRNFLNVIYNKGHA